MSYEEDYRRAYKARCACGKGFVRYFKISMSNDWGQTRESATTPEIYCEECCKMYHCESDYFGKYLIPEGLTLDLDEPTLKRMYQYTENERFINANSKEKIEEMLVDMTAPKHRFMKDLTTESAIAFAQEWAYRTRKKSLEPMISYLRNILNEYNSIQKSVEEKRPHVEKFNCKHEKYLEKLREVRKKSFKLEFVYDSEYEEQQKKAKENYEIAHRYDDFDAKVHYDESYKRDFVGQYWDTLHIEKCVEDPFLILEKNQYSPAKIIVTKKYKTHCSLCGKNKEIISSNLKVDYEDGVGYQLKESCDCHSISSFEAKTMDILNQLGVTYGREIMFDELTGDAGYPLRFDFVLYKEKDSNGNPLYDLAIELQGPHHYASGYYDEYGEYISDSGQHSIEKFDRQQRYDKSKAEFCAVHSIRLEHVKYTTNDYDRLEKRLMKILKENGYDYYSEIDEN